MNRIVIDKDINKLDIKEDANYLIINHTSNLTINIYNAKVNILFIKEKIKDESYNINIENGKLDFNNISYDSDNLNIEINLKQDSIVNIYNSIITNKAKDVKINVNHKYENTISNIYNNGVTITNGSITFDVTSNVPNKIKGCTVNQDSKIISLNNQNKNKINPILLIDEYDVSASHSAFIGKFKKQELFYLMSRGLNEKAAEKLLLEGMLIGKLNICFDEKEKLKEKLKNWR